MNLILLNMELTKTGQLSMDDAVANLFIAGKIFGIEIDLYGTGPDGKALADSYPFLRDRKQTEKIVGAIDLGNGQRQLLTLSFTGARCPAMFNYELSEIPEEVNAVHAMD